MRRIFLSLLVCFAFFSKAKAGDSIYYNHTFSPDIRTVQLGTYGVPLSPAVLTIGGTSQLQLSFDDVSGEQKSYYFTIFQCNADWTISELSAFDYLTGFNDNRITDFQFSFNTLQQYTHYNVLFPDQNTSITKSGNYIIKVYLDDNPDEVVLTRRFMVIEQKMSINGQVVRTNNINFTDTHQQLNFTVNYNGQPVSNPFDEIKVVVQQNERWDNAIFGLKPQFIQNGALDYSYMEELIFPAGKEFRNFDMQSLRYKGFHISFIDDTGRQNYVKLSPDEPRTYQKYFYYKDLNGKFVINSINTTQPDEEGDYAHVQFQLDMDAPLAGGQVYVVGAFSDWQPLPECRMIYNANKRSYFGNVFLKEGYYDYAYAYVERGKTDLDLGDLEGDWFETENDYTVYVYYRPFGTRYDQLVGMLTVNSVIQNSGSNGH